MGSYPGKLDDEIGTYEGYLLREERHGQGVNYFKGCKQYEGKWVADKKHGKGTYYFSCGSSHVGLWKDDNRDGKARGYCPGGPKKYEGDWEKDMYHGFGTLYELNESKDESQVCYQGNFVRDKKQGSGISYYLKGKAGYITRSKYEMYTGEIENGIFKGTGTLFFKNGDFLKGHWVKSCPTTGTLVVKEVGRYEGNFHDLQFHGRGIYYFNWGDRYEGEWNYGKFVNGEYHYKNGDRYKGSWTNEEEDSEGVFYKHDGSVFKRKYKFGELVSEEKVSASTNNENKNDEQDTSQSNQGVIKEGNKSVQVGGKTPPSKEGVKQDTNSVKGVEIETNSKDKDVIKDWNGFYCGGIVNGKRHGRGTQVCKNGDAISTDWIGGKMHGTGKATFFLKGDVYEGGFAQGKCEGQGKFTKKNLDVYLGGFKTGKFHGKGSFWSENANYVGFYQNGMKHGKGKWTFFSGKSVYEGDFRNDERHGKGKLKYWNGDMYEGSFEYDKFHGMGKYYYSKTGTSREGPWKLGMKHGKFITFKDGETIEEVFDENKLCGSSKVVVHLIKVDGQVETQPNEVQAIEIVNEENQVSTFLGEEIIGKKVAENQNESQSGCDNLEKFLVEMKMGMYLKKFKSEMISFEDLPFLEDSDLANIIKKPFHRKRFLAVIKERNRKCFAGPFVLKVKFEKEVKDIGDIELGIDNKKLLETVLQCFGIVEGVDNFDLKMKKGVHISMNNEHFTLKKWLISIEHNLPEVRAVLRKKE